MTLSDVFSFKGLSRYLTVLIQDAPPFSAFIDYLLAIRRKKKTKSVRAFYNVLLQEKRNDDEEINDLERDRIKVMDMKNLYEKFCFLN